MKKIIILNVVVFIACLLATIFIMWGVDFASLDVADRTGIVVMFSMLQGFANMIAGTGR